MSAEGGRNCVTVNSGDPLVKENDMFLECLWMFGRDFKSNIAYAGWKQAAQRIILSFVFHGIVGKTCEFAIL